MKDSDLKKLRRCCVTGILVLVFGLCVRSVLGDTIVVPSEYTSISASEWDDAPLGATNQHFQQVYSVSLLSGLSTGDMITAIGFRTISNEVSLAAQTVSDYSIWMGTSALAPGNLSSTFSDNRSVDFTQVRTGSLTITAGQFPGGPGMNDFGYIPFTTPFVYSGGDLLIEISYTDFPMGGVRVETPGPYNPALAQTAFGTGTSSTTADQGLYPEAIVMSFMVTPVPEPTTFALIAMGVLGIPVFRSLSNRRR